MSTPLQQQVTVLLQAWRQGDQSALEQLVPLVHSELHRLAHRYMGGERKGHTLQTTALVNEAYLRLVDSSQVQWQNRSHFFAISAQLMRRILVDFARAHRTQKRGGQLERVSLDDALTLSGAQDGDLVALDEALGTLSQQDPRKGRVVELRFFGGLTEEETAEVLGVTMGDKLVIQKFRRRKNSRTKTGHRQMYTAVKIQKITV